MDPHSTLTYSRVTTATLKAESPVSGRSLQSHLMVAVVTDKGFEEGFGPLTQITHPTQQEHPIAKSLCAAYALGPGLAWPGVLSTSQPPGYSSTPSVPPGGGLGYIIPAFADVNS